MVVQASDGGVTTWVEYFKVTVTVLDDRGNRGGGCGPLSLPTRLAKKPVVRNLLEFQAGAELTAAATDPDGDAGTTAGTSSSNR